MPGSWKALARRIRDFVHEHAFPRSTGSRAEITRADGSIRFFLSARNFESLDEYCEETLAAMAGDDLVPPPNVTRPAEDPRLELYLAVRALVQLFADYSQYCGDDREIELPAEVGRLSDLVETAIEFAESQGVETQGVETQEGEGSQNEVPSEGEPVPPPPVSGLVIGGPDESPRIDGEELPRLTVAQRDVVLACIEAGPAGLSLKELKGKSDHTDAPNILKRLCEEDARWVTVIEFAGRPGGQYRIRGRLVERPQ